MLALAASAAGAATYYVNNGSSSCSDSGPGTLAQPYCSITAALAAHAGAGNTINVLPGIYREQVTVPASGASGNPLVIQAQGGTVVVDGADDFSSLSLWTQVSGNVWRASSVTWSPVQVFADGVGLTPSTASASSIPSGTFEYVSGTGLYVNAGGGNPGSHGTEVGHRTYGFRLSGRSFVTIAGFTVRYTEDIAIYASSLSNSLVIAGNTIPYGGSHAIEVNSGSNVMIAGNRVWNCLDHGIYLTGGVTGSTVQDNESFGNARPATRAANGIHLYGSSNNLVQRNRTHDNQDSGVQINQGSNNNVCLQNQSWNNGDHGFDHLNSTGTFHIGDVAYGNYKDGFSIEGSSGGATVANCIAIDNGITTGEFDLWVDSSSSSGFTSDYNVFWNSTSQGPVKYISTTYTSVATYSSATGQDAHTRQADPRFTAAASGNFHLLSGSPAIDDANSSVANWPSNDADGHGRSDDPGTSNTGAGPIVYADRGAYEYGGTTSNQPPVAALVVTPNSGNAPLAVTADASSSHDPDGTIATYRFDFGDGTIVGPQAGATASHTYAAGNWTVAVTVTDNGGLPNTATAPVSVGTATNQPPVARLVVTPNSGTAPLAVTANASTSSDPDGSIVTYLFDFGDGTTVGPQSGSSANHTYAAGNWTARVTVTDNGGLTGTTTAPVSVGTGIDRPPIVTAPASVTVNEGQALTVNIAASDPDGQAITSLTANLTGLPAGNNARFTPGTGNTTGTLTWTPSFTSAGTYTVSFTAKNTLSGTATTQIVVSNVDRAPVVSAPGSRKTRAGNTVSFTVTASDPDGDPISSLTADTSQLPFGNTATFVVALDHKSGQFTWTTLVGQTGNFHVTFTATNALSGSATTSLRISRGLNSSQDPGEDPAAGPVLPEKLALSNAYPNPSGSTVAFALDLPQASRVEWAVFDLQGRSVWSETRDAAAGRAILEWDGHAAAGRHVGTGLYLVRVRVAGTEFTRRVLRL